MFLYLTINDTFAIEYNFHSIDFNIWRKILSVHKGDCECILYDFNENIVINLENSKEYYKFTLISKDFNLYRNIGLIFYLEYKDWNNMDEMIRKNTWKI